MENKSQALYCSVQSQLDDIGTILKLDAGAKAFIRQPMKELTISIPVKMDNGETKVFTGFRIQHNNAPRPLQGRHPLPSRRDHRHSALPGYLDVPQVRRSRYPPGRRQGRHHLQSQRILGRRAGETLPQLCAPGLGARRPRPGYPRPRRIYHPSDHGLDDG